MRNAHKTVSEEWSTEWIKPVTEIKQEVSRKSHLHREIQMGRLCARMLIESKCRAIKTEVNQKGLFYWSQSNFFPSVYVTVR